MKKWLAALAAVSAVCVIAPQAEANETIVQDGVKYEIFTTANGEKEARAIRNESYRGSTTVTFAQTVQGVPVTEIAPYAFKYSYPEVYEPTGDEVNITVTNLPSTLKKIGKSAFENAYFQNPVKIPESVETIGASAFSSASMPQLFIPPTVKFIDAGAFGHVWVTSYAEIPSTLTTDQISFRQHDDLYVSVIPVNEQAHKQYEQLYYEEFMHNGKKEVRIVGYDERAATGIVQVPATINGLQVTAIGNEAFSAEIRKTKLQKVVLPNSIRTIGNKAFFNLTENNFNISTLTQLEVVGEQAFMKNALVSDEPFVLPKTLHTIGSYAFAYNKLTAVQVAKENANIGFGAFAENTIKSVTFTEGVTEIPAHSFKDNAIVNLHLPSTVRAIGDAAFAHNALTEVALPEQLQMIGNDAFYYNALTKLSLPAAVTTIGASAFSSNQLTDVTWPAALTEIGAYAFANNCLTAIALPETLQTIGDHAFMTNRFTHVDMPSVPSIGEFIFADNPVTSVTFAEGITHIPAGLFANAKLAHIKLPSTIKTIGARAFYDNVLTNIDLPTSIEIVGDEAFADNALKNVHITNQLVGNRVFANNPVETATFAEGMTRIPNGVLASTTIQHVQLPSTVTTIGAGAFQHTNITSVELPSSLQTIEENAFANAALTSLELPEGVIAIGNQAFAQNKLTTLTLPNTVERIRHGAFKHNQLANITWSNALQLIQGEAFAYNELTTLALPNSVTAIGADAFSNNKLTSVTLPPNVKTIERGTFSGNNLTELTLHEAVKTADMNAFSNNPLTKITLQGSDTIMQSPEFATNNKAGEAFKGLYTNTSLTVPYENMDRPNGKPQTLYVAWDKQAKFKDIAGHWAQGAIESFTDKGYINGYPDGTFKPGAPIQRKHVARILNDVFKFETVKEVADFTDVPKNHPYYGAISAVQQAGIFSGDNGKFQPEANLTRGQLAKVLVLAAGIEPGGKSTFKDTPASYWGTPYVSALADLAIVKGTDGFFNPQKPITRAQFVSMTSLALEEMERRAQQ